MKSTLSHSLRSVNAQPRDSLPAAKIKSLRLSRLKEAVAPNRTKSLRMYRKSIQSGAAEKLYGQKLYLGNT
jgi:hypothetical protein